MPDKTPYTVDLDDLQDRIAEVFDLVRDVTEVVAENERLEGKQGTGLEPGEDAAKAHEQTCDRNPLVARIKELEATIQSLTRPRDTEATF